MVFVLLILLSVILIGSKFGGRHSFNKKYLDRKYTAAVNGIFVILVLLSHFSQYADLSGVYDSPYPALRTHLNQAVVATFMFYSGYGMMEAIKRRGKEYVIGIPGKFIKLLFRFDVAVFIYLALDRALNISYPRDQILLAFTTWTAIGNSNWYITAVLMMYAAMFIAFGIGLSLFSDRRGRLMGIALTFILTAVCILIQIKVERPAYCYNTMILLPLGCLYSELRSSIERIVMKNDICYFLSLLTVLVIYWLSYSHRKAWGIGGFTIWVIAFMALVLMITMKIAIYNRILEWFGSHVFSIYILQRLPMTVLDYLGLMETHKYLCLLIVFAVTILIALLFEKLTDFAITGMAALTKPHSVSRI